MGSVVPVVWHHPRHGGNLHIASRGAWISNGDRSGDANHLLSLRLYGCQCRALQCLAWVLYADEYERGLSRQDLGESTDGCGGMVNCGACAAGDVCNAGSCCTPMSVSMACQGKTCGGGPDGCGGIVNCGPCP